MSFRSHFQHGLLPLLTPPLSDPNSNTILVANAAAIIAATTSTAGTAIATAITIVWGFISNYLLLWESNFPTTLLLLLRSLPCWATIVAACHRYHCDEINVSQQYYIYLFHFSLAMIIVSLTANAIVTMMATALAMIYHRLFYASYADSGDYIFFF
jgi:hypothetical protein